MSVHEPIAVSPEQGRNYAMGRIRAVFTGLPTDSCQCVGR